MAKAELLSVQYLRGLAASLVVFYHARDQLAAAKALIPTEIGLAGVDLFFVISGLVMTYTAALNHYSPGAFVSRRAVRIIPLYWVVTALLAIGLLLAPGIFQNSRFTLDSFIQSLLFIPHANPGAAGAVFPMLKLGWTLNYEAFFYLCFAALIALGPALRTTVLTLFFIALVAIVATLQPNSIPLHFWADTIIFEFIFGCIIGVLFLKNGLQNLPKPIWVALLLAGIAALIFIGFNPLTELPRFIAWGAPCALIVMACVALEQSAREPWRNGPLHFLGDASYSIYLVHAYAVVAFRLLWVHFGLPLDGWAAVAMFVPLCIAAGIIAGCIAYIALERPLTSTARRLVRPKRPAQA